MTKLLLSLLLFIGPVYPWVLDEIISEMKDNNARIQIRLLPESAFNLDEVRKIGEHFLRSGIGAQNIAVLSIYPDRDVAAQESGVSCEGGYRQWNLLYKNFPKDRMMAADIISIRGDATLRLRTSDGAIIRQVISGEDPTELSVDGVTFEIISLGGRFRSRFEGCGVPGSVDAVVYLRTDSTLTTELCQRVTSVLAVRLGVKYIWAHFRNDYWFLCGQFPVRYPFSSLDAPPSEVTFYSLPEFACSIQCDGVSHCIGPRLMTTPSRRQQHR